MWNRPTREQLAGLPGLYETEHVPLQDKTIHLHFFLCGCDWYIAEHDGNGLFWGFAVLNNDLEMAEWGYISFDELAELKVGPGIEVDFDLFWRKRPAGEVDRIRRAQGWAADEA